MNKLINFPIIFIQYPTGSGGRFLSALIHHSLNPTKEILFDNVGSGHANSVTRLDHNFYSEFLISKKGEDIIHAENYGQFSYEDRIKFLQENLVVYHNNTNAPIVIDIHCKDINLFLEAFSNSICIQINIEDKDILHCTGNFFHKVMLNDPDKFKIFCHSYGILHNDYLIAVEKLQNLSENLEYFSWGIPYILSTAKNIENNTIFENRIFEIMFDDYMNDNIDNVLQEMLKFCNIKCDQNTYDNLHQSMLQYRLAQPKFLNGK